MKKMKVMFHIHTLTKGGAERAVTNLAKQFAEEGHDVSIVTSIKCESEYEVPQNVRRFVLCNKSNDTIGGYLNRMIGLGLELRKVVKKEKPDVLISFISGSIVRSVIATYGLKTKVIASVRNDPKFEYKGRLGELIIRFVFPKVDGFVFQTKQARDYFDKSIQEKSVIIMNSVNPIFYEVNRKPISHRVVTCGRLDKQKNQRMLINAFKEVKRYITDAHLHIYGKGPEYGNLISQINDLGLNDCVMLMGETDAIPQVMSTADVFVLSSDFEGMPNVLIEALTSGTPSISTKCPCGGPEELISHGENGLLVEVDNEKDMADALKSLLIDEERKACFSKNAKADSKRFCSKDIYNQWYSFISERI